MKKVSKRLGSLLAGSAFFFLLFVPMTARADTASQNLLINGGFEKPLSEGWKIYEDEKRTKGFSIKKDADGIAEGAASVYYDGDAATWSGIYQDIQVKPDSFYKLSYKTKLTGGRFQAHIIGVNEDGTTAPNRSWENYGRQDGNNAEYGDWFDDGSTPVSSMEFKVLRVVIVSADCDQEPVKTKGYLDAVEFIECDAVGMPIGGGGATTAQKAADPTGATAAATEEPDSSGAADNDGGGISPAVIGVIMAVVIVGAVVAVILIVKRKPKPAQ